MTRTYEDIAKEMLELRDVVRKLTNERDQLRAQLAERDGQIAMLREQLDWWTKHQSMFRELPNDTKAVLTNTAQVAAAHDERVRAEEQQRIITELTHWARRFAHVADPNTAAEVARQFDRAIAAISTAGKEET